MKKIIYIFIGCLLLTSCSGMLDIESHSAVSPGSVTSQDLSALRMGMYNKVQNSPTRESYITFDILGGDLTQSTGNAKDLINSVLSSLNSIVSNSWNGYYNALYQVNNVLSIVESLPESELRNLIIGEAHYFRAYIYHALVTRWGGVPIQKVNTMEKPFRDSEEAVWSFIEEELQTALAFLGTSSSYYYVSRDAALALKARVMLERGNLTEAATLAEGSDNRTANTSWTVLIRYFVESPIRRSSSLSSVWRKNRISLSLPYFIPMRIPITAVMSIGLPMR